MVQEVFNEHKLPAGFAQRVLENVPKLAWGTNRECTFLGALEAALAVTEHPYTYRDLMGWSGMAFRARWMSGEDKPYWCPSCAVGEMEEEIAAVEKATGWPLRVEFKDARDKPKVKRLTEDVTAQIDAARPVLVYSPDGDMAVAYGYEKGGKTLLLRDYAHGDEPLKLPPAKLGFLMMFLREHGQALPRRQVLLEALRIAVRNWERENKGLLTGKAASAMKRAAEAYGKENELFASACTGGDVFTGDAQKWSAAVRKREIAVLTQAREIEETAVAALKPAAAAAGRREARANHGDHGNPGAAPKRRRQSIGGLSPCARCALCG
jgi:hypothetical protein